MAAEIVDAPHQASPQALETISKCFTTALVQESFFEAAHDTLQELGFKRDNTFVLVNSCRDELARPISHFFDKQYGHTFNLSGISEVITAGTLGFIAATSHQPRRTRQVCFYWSNTYCCGPQWVRRKCRMRVAPLGPSWGRFARTCYRMAPFVTIMWSTIL